LVPIKDEDFETTEADKTEMQRFFDAELTDIKLEDFIINKVQHEIKDLMTNRISLKK